MAGKKRHPRQMSIYNREDFVFMVEQIHDLRLKALVCIVYLTNSRISEIVNKVKKKQIKEIIQEGKLFVYVHGLTALKRKDVIQRSIPILIEKERIFYDPIESYIYNLEDDDILFPFGRVRAYQLISKLGIFPHLLRHIRLTHLATDYGLTGPELQQMAGWTDIRPTSFYVHLNAKHIAKKMME
jgi:integrase